MPFPSTGTETARPDLADTVFEFEYLASQNEMAALRVFPVREVQEFKGDFGRYKAKQSLKRPLNAGAADPGFALQRAIRSEYAQDETEFEEDSYVTDEFGVESPVDDRESSQYRSYFEHEQVVTARLVNLLLEELEIRVEAQVFDQTNYTPGNGNALAHPVGDRWQTAATAVVLDHIQTARFGVYDNSGIWPDSIVMNRKAWWYLINTDEMSAKIHNQGAGDPDRLGLTTERIVAQILGLNNVIVAGGTQDTANPNAAFAPDQIWGPHAMVFKQAVGRDLGSPGLGRTFHWAIDDSMPNGMVESYRDPKKRANVIRVRHQMQNKRIVPEVGYLITDVYA